MVGSKCSIFRNQIYLLCKLYCLLPYDQILKMLDNLFHLFTLSLFTAC